MKIQFLRHSIYICMLLCATNTTTTQNNKALLMQQYKPLPANVTAYVKDGQIATFQMLLAKELLQAG
jgi:hypothetical protein